MKPLPCPAAFWAVPEEHDAIMGCHHAVTAVDLGVVEAGVVDARLQIVGE
jgi:hypothetical protein